MNSASILLANYSIFRCAWRDETFAAAYLSSVPFGYRIGFGAGAAVHAGSAGCPWARRGAWPGFTVVPSAMRALGVSKAYFFAICTADS